VSALTPAAPGALQVIYPPDTADERVLKKRIAELEQEYRRRAQPYIDALVKLHALKMPQYVYTAQPAPEAEVKKSSRYYGEGAAFRDTAAMIRRGYDVECQICGQWCDTGNGPCTTAQASGDAVLPPISDEDRAWLSYNPNTSDIIDWIETYARSAITAALSAQPRDGKDAARGRFLISQMAWENTDDPESGVWYSHAYFVHDCIRAPVGSPYFKSAEEIIDAAMLASAPQQEEG